MTNQIYYFSRGKITIRKVLRKTPFIVETEYPELAKFKLEQNEIELDDKKETDEEVTVKKKNLLVQLGLMEIELKTEKSIEQKVKNTKES